MKNLIISILVLFGHYQKPPKTKYNFMIAYKEKDEDQWIIPRTPEEDYARHYLTMVSTQSRLSVGNTTVAVMRGGSGARSEPPHIRRSCYDCNHLHSAVSWWCGNAKAIRARGTAIPGCIHCPYWEPDVEFISKNDL